MKILGWIIMVPVVLFVLLIVARVAFCDPNSADVKVMKPMAEKIASYILHNKINSMPKDLNDIPSLPYKIGKCIQDYSLSEYKCSFSDKNKIYQVSYRQVWSSINSQAKYIYLKIYQYGSKTGVEYDLEYDENLNKWKMAYSSGKKYKNIRIYDNKTSGICNPMKQ